MDRYPQFYAIHYDKKFAADFGSFLTKNFKTSSYCETFPIYPEIGNDLIARRKRVNFLLDYLEWPVVVKDYTTANLCNRDVDTYSFINDDSLKYKVIYCANHELFRTYILDNTGLLNYFSDIKNRLFEGGTYVHYLGKAGDPWNFITKKLTKQYVTVKNEKKVSIYSRPDLDYLSNIVTYHITYRTENRVTGESIGEEIDFLKCFRVFFPYDFVTVGKAIFSNIYFTDWSGKRVNAISDKDALFVVMEY